jgi:hypothetical protein
VLQIGMLDEPGEAYRLERNAFKHEHNLPDVDVRYPDKDDKTGGGTWKHVPKRLSPRSCQRTSIQLYDRNETKRVIFLNVPIKYKSEDIKQGATVATRVIEAMVDDLASMKSKEVREPDGLAVV